MIAVKLTREVFENNFCNRTYARVIVNYYLQTKSGFRIFRKNGMMEDWLLPILPLFQYSNLPNNFRIPDCLWYKCF